MVPLYARELAVCCIISVGCVWYSHLYKWDRIGTCVLWVEVELGIS